MIIGQKYLKYEFPFTNVDEDEKVEYKIEKDEFLDFLKISFDESEGRIILQSGRVPEDLDILKSGQQSVLIKMTDSNGVIRSEYIKLDLMKPSGIIVTE